MSTHSRQTIGVLGAGSWGTALAVMLARNGKDVRLWGHEPAHIAKLQQSRENQEFLPGVDLPESLTPTHELDAAVCGAEQILIVVPSHAFASVARQIAPMLDATTGISWATKGFGGEQGQLLHEVALQCWGGERRIAAVSGPTFAMEVARGLPTAITVASPDAEHAERVAAYLHCERLRAYTSSDIIGVQVGGGAKNVLAIAAGIADGLGFGANTRAALITRGLKELSRLGIALGGRADTFMGLAGLGDLALTCTDNQSRNRRMGLCLSRGLSIEQARAEIGQEVEGVGATQIVMRIARDRNVEMPISEQVYRVIYEGLAPKDAANALLERASKTELE
jgi:glycerol-3-phosphate dehydrogenase (NAD(P)+)